MDFTVEIIFQQEIQSNEHWSVPMAEIFLIICANKAVLKRQLREFSEISSEFCFIPQSSAQAQQQSS